MASHRKFIDKNSFAIDLLSDPDKIVLKAYGAWGQKKMYGKTYEGVVRSTVLIDPEGTVRFSWPKAKTKDHALEVLRELKRLAS